MTKEKRGFTLLELIIVIVIIGILATVGLATYTNQIEYSRLAEAKANLGAMRKLAYEYWLKNGSVTNIVDNDLGVNNTCTSANFYKYTHWDNQTYALWLVASRCTSGGKPPGPSIGYTYAVLYFPSSGRCDWYCKYADGSGCFGLPPFS